ncbi:right-handed parallel beta-helix repeat-containing protein [Methanoculleus frigidifontis]|nr:right-handed parallel beta-helix repeat-containing protein [Methanoculleus sp. FWC-SCC1]
MKFGKVNTTTAKTGDSNGLLLWSVLALAIAALLFAPVSAADVGSVPTADPALTIEATTPPCEVWVCPTYTEDATHFKTIQDGVDAVAEYGTVHVGKATYEESVKITKDGITVEAKDGATVDADGEDYGFEICNAKDVTVSGFCIINADLGGIFAEYADNLQILDNSIDLDLVCGVGIEIYDSENVVVCGNEICIDAVSRYTDGIWIQGESANPQVTSNCIDINLFCEQVVTVTDTDAPLREASVGVSNVKNLEAANGPDVFGIFVEADNACIKDNVVDICETCEYEDDGYTAAWLVGIGAYGDYNEVCCNDVTVCVPCEDENDSLFSVAYVIGIDACGDYVVVSCNEVDVCAVAAFYAYADGIYASGLKVLVEGNSICSYTEAFGVNPWGIWVEYSEKGQILDNTVCIEVYGCEAFGDGIIVMSSEKVQVLCNTVDIDACLECIGGINSINEGCGAAFWMEGIYVYDSYQPQIADNCVDMDACVCAAEIDGAIDAATSERAAAISEMHNNVAGTTVEALSGATGLDIGCTEEADVHGNEICVDVCIEAVDEDNCFALALADIFVEGIAVWNTYCGDVYDNTVCVNLDAEVAAAAGDNVEYALAIGLAETWVSGITLYDTYDVSVFANCVTAAGGNALCSFATATEEINDASVLAQLAVQGAFVQEQAVLTDESLWSIIGSADALAAALSANVVAGIVADTDGCADIYDNCVDVCVDSEITAIACSEEEIEIEDSLAAEAGLGVGLGIIGPHGEFAAITGNDVSVNSILEAAAYAEEDIGANYAIAAGLDGVAGVGIVALAYANDVSDNTVCVDICSSLEAAAIEGVPDEFAGSFGLLGSAGVGIVTLNLFDDIGNFDETTMESYIHGNLVECNDVNVTNCICLDLYAEGIGDPIALAGGLGVSAGIIAPYACINGNDVCVDACVDGAVAETYEASSLYVGSASGAAGLAVGIFSLDSFVTCNDVSATGGAEAVAIAETDALLENADGYALAAGVGIGILEIDSWITQNNVEGHGCAVAEADVDGYRTEEATLAFSAGIGVLAIGGDVTFNNLVGSDDAGLIAIDFYVPMGQTEAEYFGFIDATYNYWGAISGPSGLGPGIGDAVYGTCNYEPWLTEPFEVVVGEKKASFGFELPCCFDNINGAGYDGYQCYALEAGWNTFSTPISLVNSTWESISNIGDGLDFCIAYTWDAECQEWVQVLGSTEIDPLDAIYVKMYKSDRVPLAINPEITNPPVKSLQPGWNLIGPAYCLDQDSNTVIRDSCLGGLYWETKPVDETLISVAETPEGLTGYTLVVSPPVNCDGCWVYTIGEEYAPTMQVGEGYWVFMENCDSLGGFSSTPLKIPACDLCNYC